jgi:hypothetical protein
MAATDPPCKTSLKLSSASDTCLDMPETSPFPKCQTLYKEIIKKTDGARKWTPAKVAMLLRVRFNRERIRVDGGTELVDEAFIRRLMTGQSYAPDTLRSQIANILGIRQKDAFPEYLVACATLKREREKRQWTQREVAQRVRRHRRKLRDNEVSSFECGSRYCHPETRAILAKVFELDEQELFPEYYVEGGDAA